MRYVKVCFLLLMMVSTSIAGPREDLRDADNSYLYADYPRVLKKLVPLIEPDLKLSLPADIARAYKLSGLSAFYLKDEESAARYFEKLIRLQPDFRLDPVKVPPPAVAFYDGIRDKLADEIQRIRAALAKLAEEEKERERLKNQIRIQRDIQINSRLTAMLPLGVGQFQNGNRTMGQLFLSGQALAATSSVALFFAVESLRTESGRFRTSDLDRSRQYRDAQLITGTAAIALAVIGIIEAQINFVPQHSLGEKVISNDKTGASGSFQLSF